MSSTNKKNTYTPSKTHEGGNTSRINIKEQFKRTVMSCMLWENTFYEDGISIADRIESYLNVINEEDAREILYQAKFESKLRHLP
jgi:60 kDa SS-A/Ro ribonucleoprotein